MLCQEVHRVICGELDKREEKVCEQGDLDVIGRDGVFCVPAPVHTLWRVT